MSRIDEISFVLDEQQPTRDAFLDDCTIGLAQRCKSLPCKYFYDERGSRLFDRICELDEYYPTRTELSITRDHAPEIAELLGSDCLLVEFGSGSSVKTRLLLDQLIDPAGYIPIDISGEHLFRTASALADRYPSVAVMPLCADYTADLELPPTDAAPRKVAGYFPGSTIGNFEPPAALEFLRRVRKLCGRGSGLLIGVDLKKDPRLLHAAYNDAAGVTAEFNLNLLARINRELRGNFTLDAFAHYAFFNPVAGRVEMHLASLERQSVQIAGRRFRFETGESIHTENCYKYTLEGFAKLAERAGYRVRNVWLDELRLFSLQYLVSA